MQFITKLIFCVALAAVTPVCGESTHLRRTALAASDIDPKSLDRDKLEVAEGSLDIANGIADVANALLQFSSDPSGVTHSELRQFRHQAGDLLDKLQKQLHDGNDRSQVIVDRAAKDFSQCDSSLNSTLRHAFAMNSSIEVARLSHMTCRQAEKAAYDAWKGCVSQLSLAHVGNSQGSGSDGAAVGKCQSEFQKLQTFCSGSGISLAMESTSCEEKKTAWENKKNDCALQQHAFETGLCTQAHAVRNAWDSYLICYESKEFNFRLVVETEQTNSRIRENQWHTASKVRCLSRHAKVDSAESDSDNVVVDRHCKEKEGVVSPNITLSIPAVPPRNVPTVPDSEQLPGSRQFKEKEYSEVANQEDLATMLTCVLQPLSVAF
eukprot:TRINITY_DN8908_c1_g1_i1.p1 TRINITY_DN8908_c1_g1~~TRINITY_DN8908_c1_g1_i1.p1  ORF type:complete len:379 (+),score=56.16 TRINITY_DN8908_c1_g1_i1:90-1226(+)